MKVLIYADPHWSSTSSILRQRGRQYSIRLENLISSINWVEQLAKKNECEKIICLGDFFDKDVLNSEELTALKEVDFSENIPHVYLCGNHEMGGSSGLYSSAFAVGLLGDYIYRGVVSYPVCEYLKDCVFCYLPYIRESDRSSLSEYIDNSINKKVIVFSHNDIKGIYYGKIKSETGFDVEDIKNSCDLYFNGHIHNGGKIGDKIVNVGNLTGQNFNEDAEVYKHGIYILNTDDLSYEYIQNPYALNFYKLDMTARDSFPTFSNAVVSLQCYEEHVEEYKRMLENDPNVLSFRVVTIAPTKQSDMINKTELDKMLSNSLDHLGQFRKYVVENIGSTKMISEELVEVLK